MRPMNFVHRWLESRMETPERQKLDAMKELAYGASHEINNPLANISARAQTLLRDETHPAVTHRQRGWLARRG